MFRQFKVGRQEAIALACAGASIAIVLLTFLLPWPEDWKGWFGEKALFDVITGTIAPLGAIAALTAIAVNLRVANRTYEFTRRAEIVGRFQKGAEMLTKKTTAQAGAHLLAGVARAEPSTYEQVVVETLRGFLAENDLDLPPVSHYFRTDKTQKYQGDWPASSLATIQALETISELHSASISAKRVKSASLNIYQTYLCLWTVDDLDFSNVVFSPILLSRFTFQGTNLSRATIRGGVRDLCTFANCDLTGATFDLIDVSTELPASPATLRFLECVGSEAATVNGVPFAVWAGTESYGRN